MGAESLASGGGVRGGLMPRGCYISDGKHINTGPRGHCGHGCSRCIEHRGGHELKFSRAFSQHGAPYPADDARSRHNSCPTVTSLAAFVVFVRALISQVAT